RRFFILWKLFSSQFVYHGLLMLLMRIEGSTLMSSLQLTEVSKIYGDKTAVDHLNIEVGRGEIFGLLGANGAGKTTTMRMVLGLIYPDEGVIRYDGKPFSQELIKNLGYLPEERGLYPKVRVSDQIIYLAGL